MLTFPTEILSPIPTPATFRLAGREFRVTFGEKKLYRRHAEEYRDVRFA